MTASDWISLTAALIQGLPAAAVAYVAYSGLRTWKYQVKGREEYECALNLLRSTDRLLCSMRAYNIPPGNTTDEEGFLKVFGKHLEDVGAARAEFETCGREARIHWGTEDADEALRPMRECHAEYAAKIGEYRFVRFCSDQPEEERGPRLSDLQRFLYLWYTDVEREDPFHKKVNDAASRVEELTRPRMLLS